ncbi:MAG: hypothetical protein LBK66_05280 [Spirochaetaceae bacterium]|nr:hypothetical protein [Spirochaetaceae bacterium]
MERNHALDHDRLVKELRLAGISTIVEANKFLNETYLPKMNGKFSRPAADAADAHIPLGNGNLSDIFCREYERTVGSDYVVRFESRHFQILKANKNLPRPKDKVTVLIRLDDSFCIQWKKNSLLAPEIEIQKNDRSGNNAA